MCIYYYIFYKIHKLIEKPDFSWWSDFRASLLISIIEGLFLFLIDFKIYKYTGVGVVFNLGKWPSILILGFPPIIINHFIFIHKNRWEKIVKYFDTLEKRELVKMNYLFILILFLLIFLFSI